MQHFFSDFHMATTEEEFLVIKTLQSLFGKPQIFHYSVKEERSSRARFDTKSPAVIKNNILYFPRYPDDFYPKFSYLNRADFIRVDQLIDLAKKTIKKYLSEDFINEYEFLKKFALEDTDLSQSTSPFDIGDLKIDEKERVYIWINNSWELTTTSLMYIERNLAMQFHGI